MPSLSLSLSFISISPGLVSFLFCSSPGILSLALSLSVMLSDGNLLRRRIKTRQGKNDTNCLICLIRIQCKHPVHVYVKDEVDVKDMFSIFARAEGYRYYAHS